MKNQFLLDSTITYLNHGSFGACAKPIFEAYQQFQLELEREPVQFIVNNAKSHLAQAKIALGKLVNVAPEDFFFLANPTTAVNNIIASLDLKSGDEVLMTDLEYGAMDRSWDFYAKKSGFKVVRQHIELPVISQLSLLENFTGGITPRTKAIFINQISSATALRFPVSEICEIARSRGLITIIDGAHVPGHIDLDIQKMDPDFYTGTCHKWLLAPKGSSFLYVGKDFQQMLQPSVISWSYEPNARNLSFPEVHEVQGTRDITAFLAVKLAVDFLEKNNWKQNADRCTNLILEYYPRFCDLVGSSPICPIDIENLSQMCSVPIRTKEHETVKNLLYKKYQIEIPIMESNGNHYMRISMNWYNDRSDLEILYKALEQILSETDLLQS